MQPILRYDLGDSILQRPDPCPCGNPLPAIRVRGRVADMLTFPTDRGERVTVAPLVLDTLVDRTPGVELFQIVQSTATTLRVRLRTAADADPDQVWRAVESEITRLFVDHGLGQKSRSNARRNRQSSPPAASTARSSR